MATNPTNPYLRIIQERNLNVQPPQPSQPVVPQQPFIQQSINPPPIPPNNYQNPPYQDYTQSVPPQPPVNINPVNPVNPPVQYYQQPINPLQSAYIQYVPANQYHNPEENLANMLLDELDQFTKQVSSIPFKAEPNGGIEKKFPYATPTAEIQAERALFTVN